MTGPSILAAAIAAAPTCEARTGYRAGEFTEEPLWCNGQRGLRSFTDVKGMTHWYCAAPRHRESVVRQHGPRAELERGTATFDAPAEEGPTSDEKADLYASTWGPA